MFSFFRRGIMAKVMLGILFATLVAMVVTGFGTGGSGGLGELGGLGASNVASVGGQSITTDRVKEETKRQLERMRQQKPDLDMAAFLARGSIEEIVDQLISITASVSFGESQGLGASRQMVDKEIASIPAFQNLAGQFDDATFRRALQQERLSEDQLREEIRTRLIQRQLVLPAAGSAFVPDGLAQQYASLLLETRTGTVGAVPTGAMGPGAEPSDAELAAYFRQNQGRYTIPERRVIRYAVFGMENVAAAAKATDADIAAAYKANSAAYAPREVRTLSQVVLPAESAARAFAQKLAGGASFAQAAQQAGFAPSDIAIGDQSKEAYAKLSAANVADAVFAAAKGATVGPIRSGLGWHIVHVDNIKTDPGKPLASVRAELAAGIEKQKAQDAIQDMASRIENAIGGGASFEEVAKKEGLQIQQTAPVTPAGVSPEQPAWKAPPELAPILDAAFQMEPDEDPVVEPVVPDQRFALVGVVRATPAAPPPLAQIRDRVKADFVTQRASERARAVAQSIVSKINAGVPAAEAFSQAQVKLPPVQPLSAVRRDIAKQGQQVPPPLAMLFSLPRGKARLLPAPDRRGWFVVYLASVVPGDANKEPGLKQAVRGQFAQIMGDEYAQQFMGAIRAGMKVKRNDQAIAKVKRDLLGAPAQ